MRGLFEAAKAAGELHGRSAAQQLDHWARQRYRRLWGLVAQARQIVDRATFYDNTSSKLFRPVAIYERGRPVGARAWPTRAPPEITTDE